MSKYVPYKDVSLLALQSLGLVNSEWAMLVQGLQTIEIVHCRECKYAHMTDNGYCKYCDQWTDEDGVLIEVYHDKNFYCGYGERKDDAQ